MANKQEQVLIIDPQNELKFRGPFTQPVTSYIKLSNPTTTPVVFKIKTTAPKRYCVRPNAGVVEPKSLIPIAVSLQPFEFDPNEKNKHKFMVQTMIVQDSRVNLETLWKEVDSENLMDSKLKCVFEMPVDGDAPTSAPSQASNDKVDSSNEEMRRIGESQSGSPDSGELAKAAKEVKYLREEESSLRYENLKLKEEVEVLRRKLQQSAHSGGGGGGGLQKSSAPNSITSNQGFMILFLGTAIGMALIGIWLGKYML
ncbi:vesicle-associated membrane protein-associated protein B [Nilaparvata lugens]|uniref:vesicle-associated membrane protein-associated protein B n=1 Tax=Nilaparvata lugens TaxID=108931 RepID=UPI00193DC31A|nr:vesicle-associated membrane protein-associated protein B [Nilaparvata lugens]